MMRRRMSVDFAGGFAGVGCGANRPVWIPTRFKGRWTMATRLLPLAAAGAMAMVCSWAHGAEPPAGGASIYDFTVKSIDGQDVPLAKYKGDVLLIVNVASR